MLGVILLKAHKLCLYRVEQGGGGWGADRARSALDPTYTSWCHWLILLSLQEKSSVSCCSPILKTTSDEIWITHAFTFPREKEMLIQKVPVSVGSFSCLSKTFGQPLGMGVEKRHLLQICSWRDNLRISKQCQSSVIPQPFHACSLARWRCCYVAKRN